MGELLELADRMERYYSDKGTYAGATLGTTSANIFHKLTDKGNYQLSIDNGADTVSFTVRAKPQGGQMKDKCGTFILHSDGNKEVAPPPSLSTPDPTMVGECWK
jgi:type IV pilus assembly protein PilE